MAHTPPISRLAAAYQFAKLLSVDDTELFGEFARLQRVNIVQLQNELASLKPEEEANNGLTTAEMLVLRHTMHEYSTTDGANTTYSTANSTIVTAIKDFEYVSKLTKSSDKDNLECQMRLQATFPATSNRKGSPYNTTYRTLYTASYQKSDAVREFLRNFLPKNLARTADEREIRMDDYWHGKPPNIYSK